MGGGQLKRIDSPLPPCVPGNESQDSRLDSPYPLTTSLALRLSECFNSIDVCFVINWLKVYVLVRFFFVAVSLTLSLNALIPLMFVL